MTFHAENGSASIDPLVQPLTGRLTRRKVLKGVTVSAAVPMLAGTTIFTFSERASAQDEMANTVILPAALVRLLFDDERVPEDAFRNFGESRIAVPVTNPIHLSHQNFPHRVHCWSGRVSAQTPMPDAGVPR